MSFTIKNTLGDIAEAPELYPYNKYMMYSNPYNQENKTAAGSDMTLEFSSAIGWSPEGIVNGLNYLSEKMAANQTEQFFLYDNDNAAGADEQMKEVNLICVKPEKRDSEKKVALLVSGGGYQAISMMVDGLPCVRSFCERGYQVFLLTYRIGDQNVLPRSLEDMANALRFMKNNSDRLGIDMDTLVIAGFSAGANLVATWQLPEVGYRSFDLSQAKCTLLVYGYYDLEDVVQRKALPGVWECMLGDDFKEHLKPYNVASEADSGFSPAYIICGAADGLVSPMNSKLLKARLDQKSVRSVFEIAPETDHGFGDGTGTNAEGWLDRAFMFIDSLTKK